MLTRKQVVDAIAAELEESPSEFDHIESLERHLFQDSIQERSRILKSIFIHALKNRNTEFFQIKYFPSY